MGKYCKSFMLHKCILALLAGLLTASMLQTNAKPAWPGWRSVMAADGTEMKVTLRGDEFSHQYFSEDGYPLENRGGVFYYCGVTPQGDLISTDLAASAISARSDEAVRFLSRIDRNAIDAALNVRALNSPMRMSSGDARSPHGRAPRLAQPYDKGPGLFPDATFPAYGRQKALVVLVEFSDVRFTLSDPHDYFSRMLGQRGFSDYGATGCAEEYFEVCSGGAFLPEFVLAGPVTLSRPMKYYGGNQGGTDAHAADMIVEACRLVDGEVDFSEFDRDGDGFIDNVYVFYAGQGEATCDDPDTVWPHSWNITQAFSAPQVFDGKQLDYYACSNEWETASGKGRPDGVGTFIHEFSHVLGLPDLYETSYNSGSFTPGTWSVLDYGPYNNDGMTPPLYGAFERYALGWIKPREVDRPVNATLQPIGENAAGIIRTGRENEFFLLENRQQTGWDTFIPGHGMLVWHIDFDATTWTRNIVNNDPTHQRVDIVEADNRLTEWTRDGDCFPGVSGISSFTSQTRPAMRTWSGKEINFPLYDIAETPDGNVTFTVLDGSAAPLAPTIALEAENVSADTFTALWEPVEGCDHLLSVYTTDGLNGADRVYLEGYCDRNVGEEGKFVVEGISENTTYFYTVKVTNGWETSVASDPVEVYTGRRTLDYYRPQVVGAEDVTSGEFTAVWLPLEDCDNYLLLVYLKENDEPYADLCDFADGVKVLPEGWESTSRSSYSNASYSGEAIPALRLGNQGDMLTTPSYPDGASALSFWHRGNGTGAGDMVKVMASNGNAWVEAQAFDIVTEKGGRICEIEELPEGTVAVRIVFERISQKGSLAIDDVKIAHGMKYDLTVMPEFADLPTGNVTSCRVEGLNPATEYAFSVRGTDGQLISLESEKVLFRTKEVGGISGQLVSANGLRVNGMTVSASDGAWMVAHDTAGREVANGFGKMVLPGAGFYIVSVPSSGEVAKIVIK